MEIVDFKNFEQFQVYVRQHGQQMQYWSEEELQNFNEKVLNLIETNPEFKEKYEKWVKKNEEKQKKPIIIGGSKEETARSRALIMLKKAQLRQKNKKLSALEIAKRKKVYTI